MSQGESTAALIDRRDDARSVIFRGRIWHCLSSCLLAVLFGECFLANRTTA